MKLYCPICRRKVEVKNPTERIVPINHGQRKLMEGMDAKGHKVAQFVSMKPQVAKPTRKRKAKKRSSMSYFPSWS
jgi:hypothetical protein